MNPKIIRLSFYPFNEIIFKARYDDNGQGYSTKSLHFICKLYITFEEMCGNVQHTMCKLDSVHKKIILSLN